MGLLREMTVTSTADSVSLSLQGALWQSRALYIVAWGSNTKYSKMISPNVKVVIKPQHRARLYRKETRVSVGMAYTKAWKPKHGGMFHWETWQCKRCKRCGFNPWEVSLEEEMVTHPNILAWRIPWIEETGGLQSTRSHRVRYD